MAKTLLSQGAVRPGVVQPQCWRETGYRYFTTGPNGERVPVYVLGSRLVTVPSHADPRLAHKVAR